ncbi:mannitol-1-phosphate 5-dehydrogenase [Bacillus sp. SB49]|uniref:mannitol-1-phosphate 5-dehydrogenase n=1 Tax=Bacillaceae TaxID=186817 RepID=UPI0002A50460|nr:MULTISPECIES: mannitol-1-phosphate 5-dehydrogenase [Bacillaceae]ELK47853.1 mannitol dehydrogenase domain-containing protein [Halobacillus sp. BAB-2008]QHT48518.1 mannitol-1-phosphate 5-dehydrogenase [Bacillus sp. SB49]
MKSLHFGAGNIGRGLIGCLLNKTGLDVCFVDVNEETVDQLNRQKGYAVKILDDQHSKYWIEPVHAISGRSEDVSKAIIETDLITTSVGPDNLAKIAPAIAKGLMERVKQDKKPIQVIANENMVNASTKLQEEVYKHIPEDEKSAILSKVGFPNSAIDRLSLSESSPDGEITLVEPYYEWIIETGGKRSQDLPPIKDVTYVETLGPFIERKLFMVNLGHAAVAYTAFLKGHSTIQSALDDPEVEGILKRTLQESSAYFMEAYDFNKTEMDEFIDRTIQRFKNKNIRDDVTRVARSPIRKLGFQERIIAPMRSLFQLELPIDNLLSVAAAALSYDNPEDEESVALQNHIRDHGIEEAIIHFTSIKESALRTRIKDCYLKVQNSQTKTINNGR